MIFKAINILGLTLAFIGALLLARPWRLVIHQGQTERDPGNLESARSVAALNNRVAATVLDRMHQLDRRTTGLAYRKVLNEDGLVDRAALDISYREITAKRATDYATSESRDLSVGAVWFILAGFFLQLIAGIFM